MIENHDFQPETGLNFNKTNALVWGRYFSRKNVLACQKTRLLSRKQL
jgi:hypothetical protein